MKAGTPSILVIGIGNPGREDDGAGIEVARMVEELGLESVEVRCDYQLNVEDAFEISRHAAAFLVDASVADIGSCRMSAVTPDAAIDFTTHSVSPGGVASLCQQLYGARPDIRLLEIKGHSFEFREGLSDAARANVNAAFAVIRDALETMCGGSAPGRSPDINQGVHA